MSSPALPPCGLRKLGLASCSKCGARLWGSSWCFGIRRQRGPSLWAACLDGEKRGCVCRGGTSAESAPREPDPTRGARWCGPALQVPYEGHACPCPHIVPCSCQTWGLYCTPALHMGLCQHSCSREAGRTSCLLGRRSSRCQSPGSLLSSPCSLPSSPALACEAPASLLRVVGFSPVTHLQNAKCS